MKKLFFISILLSANIIVMAQDKKITRIAKITVDPVQVNTYSQLLKEQMDAAIKNEPGVISYTVYADKLHPNIITIIEVYASNEAYLSHRETAHFKKYKAATKDMVQSLELSEVTPFLSAAKEQ